MIYSEAKRGNLNAARGKYMGEGIQGGKDGQSLSQHMMASQTAPNPLPLQPGASPLSCPRRWALHQGRRTQGRDYFHIPPPYPSSPSMTNVLLFGHLYTARQGVLDQNRPTMNCLILDWTEHVE